MAVEPQLLSVGFMPLETRRDIIRHLAARADELRYTAFFLPETWTYDSTLLLTELAIHTQHIRLASGVLSIWGRSAATIAMASTSLHEISNGRFILGLGASTQQLTEGLHDVAYQVPYTKIRQVVTQVKTLLRGDRVPLYAVPAARPLGLNLPAHPDLPIYLAASSPTSIRIAGELCDGWLPFLLPRDRLADGIALLQEGAARAPASKPLPQVCPAIPAVVAEDTATARKGAAWFVAFYLTMMGPIYRNALVQWGFAKEVAAIVEANSGPNPAIVPPEADVLLEQLTVYGTPQQVREQLARWYMAGAAMPGLVLAPNLSRTEIDFTLQAFRPGSASHTH
jgi:alkanesulfonate monooxygenase SsuD/methylene tetrahydromethanopterin reductase-like flavin-dependent oxidoreductase (luciferase family)